MRRKLTIILAIAVMTIAANIVLADMQAYPAGSAMGPGFGPKITKELNLTSTQIDQMNAIHSDFMQATTGLRDQVAGKMKEMGALWANTTTTTEQLKVKADEIDALRTQIRNIGIDKLTKARDILTPEQRTQVHQMIQNNPGWLFEAACGIGMEYYKGIDRMMCGVATAATEAKGPACGAVAPSCKVECPTCSPAPEQVCPTCVKIYPY